MVTTVRGNTSSFKPGLLEKEDGFLVKKFTF